MPGFSKAPNLISVVMPSYNTEKYLSEAICSVIEQTYSELELIVVDDGSEDQSLEVLKSLNEKCRARFRRVIFEARPHSGPCPTVAHGCALAQGDYLFIVDSDDLLKPNAAEVLKAALDAEPTAALAFGDADIIDPEGRPAALNEYGLLYRDGDAKRHLRQCDFFRTMSHGVAFDSPAFGSYQSFFAGNYTAGTCLVRRTAYDAVGGFETEPKMLIKDWHLVLKLSREYKIKFVDQLVYSYRRHPRSVMTNKPRQLNALAQTIEWLRRGIAERNLDWEVRLWDEFVAGRTSRVDFFRLGNLVGLYGEKFGLGEYLAIRSLKLEIFGRRLTLRCKKYLAYHDGFNQPLSRRWNPAKP